MNTRSREDSAALGRLRERLAAVQAAIEALERLERIRNGRVVPIDCARPRPVDAPAAAA